MINRKWDLFASLVAFAFQKWIRNTTGCCVQYSVSRAISLRFLFAVVRRSISRKCGESLRDVMRVLERSYFMWSCMVVTIIIGLSSSFVEDHIRIDVKQLVFEFSDFILEFSLVLYFIFEFLKDLGKESIIIFYKRNKLTVFTWVYIEMAFSNFFSRSKIIAIFMWANRSNGSEFGSDSSVKRLNTSSA